MKHRTAFLRVRKREGGYALLLVVFLTAILLITSMSVGLRILTEGRRQKEQEMIWRGKQYTRGIKMYYRKFGRFPTSMDNLTKPQNGNIRFMRQPYTDPMNKDDGSWRLIYVGPAGQLIGSLKPQPSLQLPGIGQAGVPTPSTGILSTSGNSPFGAGPTTPAPGGFGAGTATGTTTGTGAATGTGTGATGTDATGAGTEGQPIPDTPTIVGGNIIGVGSKINKSSIMVYDKATNYRLFEFIWDPSKDMAVISTSSSGPSGATPAGSSGATQGQAPSGSGQQPNPINPQQPPQQPNQNPPQQQ